MLLEICIDSYTSALAAKNGGADRLEVCSALAAGGTTPSTSLVELCVNELNMPTMMMIRPHDGGFVYGDDDIRTMIGSIKIARSIGIEGIVFGALTSDHKIDTETNQRLLDAAGEMETTFHRAIDVAANPLQALAEVEQLGFTRVLTSGQQPTAIAGVELIGKMVRQSNSIAILAGSGVNALNVAELIQQTGVTEVHASANVATPEAQANGRVSFGEHRRITSADQVRQIKINLKSQ